MNTRLQDIAVFELLPVGLVHNYGSMLMCQGAHHALHDQGRQNLLPSAVHRMPDNLRYLETPTHIRRLPDVY